jgi:hypothetical protein
MFQALLELTIVLLFFLSLWAWPLAFLIEQHA